MAEGSRRCRHEQPVLARPVGTLQPEHVPQRNRPRGAVEAPRCQSAPRGCGWPRFFCRPLPCRKRCGTLGIVDFDRVEPSNLNRQVLHGVEDIGKLKVESARSAIERINPDVNVIPFTKRLAPENALDIMGKFDIVLDGSDNVGTKFLLNDACHLLGKPYVFGGAVGFEGQVGVFWPKHGGPCLRCLFPRPPSPDQTPTCSETGVLGVVPGQIGLVQATEVAKLILGIGTPMIGKFYIYNALTLTMNIVDVGRNAGCDLCGENPRIKNLTGEVSADYDSGQECRQATGTDA